MPNILSAGFRNHSLTVPLRKATIHQKFGNHGLAILDFEFRNQREYVMPESETPARVAWGKTPLGARNFYGYVNHYETVTEDAKTYTRMFVLGTSKVLNSGNPYTWHGMTHSGIARDIGRRHHLRTVVSPTQRVLPAWSTGNQSDFLALNALAAEIGFYTWIDGATLFFLDPKKVLRSAADMQVPLFLDSNVREASTTGGRNAPVDDSSPVRRRILHGLDYRTNEFFTATGGDKNAPDASLGQAANNYSQATEVTRAAGFQDENYYRITASVDGNANVYPGNLVSMGSGSVNRDRQGYWFVTDATHQVSMDDFVTKWNGVRGTDSTPKGLRLTTVSDAKRQTNAVIRRGLNWEAEVQEHVNA